MTLGGLENQIFLLGDLHEVMKVAFMLFVSLTLDNYVNMDSYETEESLGDLVNLHLEYTL